MPIEKEEIIKQLNFTYIIIAVVIALAIVGFGAMNFISSQKNQQIEQMKIQQSQLEQQNKLDLQKQQVEQNQQEQTTRKQKLDACLSDAFSSYSETWYSNCKSLGRLTDNCISLHDMTFEDYAKQNNIPSMTEDSTKYWAAWTDFYKKRNDCSCLLPTSNADSYNKTLADDKALCAKLYGTQ